MFVIDLLAFLDYFENINKKIALNIFYKMFLEFEMHLTVPWQNNIVKRFRFKPIII